MSSMPLLCQTFFLSSACYEGETIPWDRINRGYSDKLGRSDVVIYGRKNQGEIASFFNKLAETIAVLSFCPGGIELFGLRYESVPLLAARQSGEGASPASSAPCEGEG
jgi:hypothetical protein